MVPSTQALQRLVRNMESNGVTTSAHGYYAHTEKAPAIQHLLAKRHSQSHAGPHTSMGRLQFGTAQGK